MRNRLATLRPDDPAKRLLLEINDESHVRYSNMQKRVHTTQHLGYLNWLYSLRVGCNIVGQRKLGLVAQAAGAILAT